MKLKEYELMEQVIATLEPLGIAVKRGYALSRQPCLKAPIMTVSLKNAEAHALTLTVRIFAQVQLGGLNCEDLALTVANMLGDIGGVCKVGACTFESAGSRFTLPVEVTFYHTSQELINAKAQPEVQINGEKVANVVQVETGFTATTLKGKDPNTQQVCMLSGERRWRFVLKDLVGAEGTQAENPDQCFRLDILREGEVETLRGCCWEKITTQVTAFGVLRTRSGITCNPPSYVKRY